MSVVTHVNAKERALAGSSKSKKLRRSGKVPAIVYGAGKDVKNIELDHNSIKLALDVESFHSSILDLEVGGKTEKVLLRDFQVHPYKQKITHVDFMRINPKTKLTISVPLDFQGVAPGTKRGGVLVKKMDYVKISVFPDHIPTSIVVDLSQLQIGQFITVNDLDESNFDILSTKTNPIIRIEAPRKAIEVSDNVESEISDAETNGQESSE